MLEMVTALLVFVISETFFLKRLSVFRESRRWTWYKSFHGIDYKPQLLTIIDSRDYSFTANFNRVSSHWREGQMGSTPLGRPLSHWPTLASFTFLLNSYSAWKLKFLEEIVRDWDLFLTAENTIDQILYMDVHFLCYLHITESIKKCSGFSVNELPSTPTTTFEIAILVSVCISVRLLHEGPNDYVSIPWSDRSLSSSANALKSMCFELEAMRMRIKRCDSLWRWTIHM